MKRFLLVGVVMVGFAGESQACDLLRSIFRPFSGCRSSAPAVVASGPVCSAPVTYPAVVHQVQYQPTQPAHVYPSQASPVGTMPVAMPSRYLPAFSPDACPGGKCPAKR